MEGWIKLHRKIRENPIFSNMQLFRLWIICLTEASHKEHDQLVGNQMVKLEPGQFVTGRFELHSTYNQGLKKKEIVSEYTVWRWLLKLQEYDFLSIKSNNKFSIVTVVNWSKYQSVEQVNEQQVSNKRATSEQQVSTNKNGKNDKEVCIVDSNECDRLFEQFWSKYPSKVGKSKAKAKWKTYYKKGEIDISSVMTGTERYIRFIEHEQKKGFDRRFKDGSTFVNQKGWEEDWPIPVNKEKEVTRNRPELVTTSKEESDYFEEIRRRQRERNKAANGM